MPLYLFSPAAEADILSIWDYTFERWGEKQARRYTQEIIAACEALSRGESQGRRIDHIRPGYRKLAVGQHFLIYRHTDEGVVDVIRILHQRMDIETKLN